VGVLSLVLMLLMIETRCDKRLIPGLIKFGLVQAQRGNRSTSMSIGHRRYQRRDDTNKFPLLPELHDRIGQYFVAAVEMPNIKGIIEIRIGEAGRRKWKLWAYRLPVLSVIRRNHHMLVGEARDASIRKLDRMYVHQCSIARDLSPYPVRTLTCSAHHRAVSIGPIDGAIACHEGFGSSPSICDIGPGSARVIALKDAARAATPTRIVTSKKCFRVDRERIT